MDSTAAYISRFNYEYDNTGNRTNVLEVNGDRVTWSYDATYQLKSEHRSGTNTFTYDATGNRTVKNENTVLTTSTFDVANQLATSIDIAGTTTFTFDSNGNQQIQLEPNSNRTVVYPFVDTAGRPFPLTHGTPIEEL